MIPIKRVVDTAGWVAVIGMPVGATLATVADIAGSRVLFIIGVVGMIPGVLLLAFGAITAMLKFAFDLMPDFRGKSAAFALAFVSVVGLLSAIAVGASERGARADCLSRQGWELCE